MRSLPNRDSVDILLYRAGMPMTPQRFLLASALLAVGGWLFGAAILRDLVLGLIGALAGLVPWLAIRSAGRQRMRRFDEQFGRPILSGRGKRHAFHGLPARRRGDAAAGGDRCSWRRRSSWFDSTASTRPPGGAHEFSTSSRRS
jgi:hypothetical protein